MIVLRLQEVACFGKGIPPRPTRAAEVDLDYPLRRLLRRGGLEELQVDRLGALRIGVVERHGQLAALHRHRGVDREVLARTPLDLRWRRALTAVRGGGQGEQGRVPKLSHRRISPDNSLLVGSWTVG